MNPIDWSLLAAIMAAIAFAVRQIRSSRKKGGGCFGNCSACGGCPPRRANDTKK